MQKRKTQGEDSSFGGKYKINHSHKSSALGFFALINKSISTWTSLVHKQSARQEGDGRGRVIENYSMNV